MLKYTPQGDTLWTKKISRNPTGAYNGTDELIIAPDSSYILAGQTNILDSNSFVVMQIERDGNLKWYKNFNYTSNVCINHTIVPLEDGFVMGYANTDLNHTPIDYTVLCQLKKMDYNGNVLWEWQNDSSIQLEGANDLIRTKDGGWVIGTAIGKEFLRTGGTSSIFAHDSYIFKLDSARNWLWGTPLRAYSYSVHAKVVKVIEQPDSSLMTFDCASLSLKRYRSHHCPMARDDGDSLWSHQYYYAQQWGAVHEIERRTTHDGGYLIAGQAKLNGQGVYQQGWLLKLDQHGCLPRAQAVILGFYPYRPQEAELKTPTQRWIISMYYMETRRVGEKLTFQILDGQGRVLQIYKARRRLLFPVWDLLAGWYVLEVHGRMGSCL